MNYWRGIQKKSYDVEVRRAGNKVGRSYKIDKRVFHLFAREFNDEMIKKLADRMKHIALESEDERASIKATELIFKVLAANELINNENGMEFIERNMPPISHDILTKFQEEYENYRKTIDVDDARVLP